MRRQCGKFGGKKIMDQVTARKLLRVGEAFHLPGPFFSYEEVSQGNVNRTYKVNYIRDDGTGMAQIKPYLMQRVNTYAFKNPIQLMENIDKVTEYIRQMQPNKLSLHYHHTDEDGERKTYLLDNDNGFWRVCNYVPSVTFDTCDDIRVVRNAGEAFGDFQMQLSDFDASQLYYTIPDFHNTRKRYETLIQDMHLDPCGRVAEVKEELDWLLSVQDQACRLTDLYNEGRLPLRVTHNDTKLNNVLLDSKTRKGVCVIDLDTVMPGLAAWDFGDAIRYGANDCPEDEPDVSKVYLNMQKYETYLRGYLDAAGAALTPLEKETLPWGARVITLETGIRFLTDYLEGDHYFRIRRPNQNLDRTRKMLKLTEDMEAHFAQMGDAVARYEKQISCFP
jgi:thiamine kinase-like enzyme